MNTKYLDKKIDEYFKTITGRKIITEFESLGYKFKKLNVFEIGYKKIKDKVMKVVKR